MWQIASFPSQMGKPRHHSSSYHGGRWRYGHAGGGHEPPPSQPVLPATAQPSPALTSLSPPQPARLLAQLCLPMVRKGPSQQPIHHHAPVARHPLRATGQWQPFCVCSSLLWLPVMAVPEGSNIITYILVIVYIIDYNIIAYIVYTSNILF